MVKPNTYTLIVKVDPTWDLPDITAHVAKMMTSVDTSSYTTVVARVAHGEALVLLHTLDDSSRYGIALAQWLGMAPYSAPFNTGSLLWYR